MWPLASSALVSRRFEIQSAECALEHSRMFSLRSLFSQQVRIFRHCRQI